jgi:uncharacterized integral membrane protein
MSQIHQDGAQPNSARGEAHPQNAPQSRRIILTAYKQMLTSLFLATLAVILILFVFLLPFYYQNYGKVDVHTHDPPLMIVVVLAGTLGALFSALLRLYRFEDLPKALFARELVGLPSLHRFIYSLVPVVVGAISATALYLLFASELIKGDLFPAFTCKKGDDNCTTFGLLMSDWGPAQAIDYAKALVWGFIAGFAERLVPDLLQGLSHSAEKRDQSAPGESPRREAGA